MYFLVCFIFIFFVSFVNASNVLMYDAYGYYNYEKVYNINENRKYIIYSNQAVVLTDLGITGDSNCHGIQEFENGKSLDANVMCHYRERNGDEAFLHFKTVSGQEDVRTNSFKIISGTGRWKHILGIKCIGATARISEFKNGYRNAAFEWKGKCIIPDKKYIKFKNYKKSN